MKPITIKDVARKAGVSISTVSRVLNKSGSASERIRESVSEAAEFLQYKPNALAQSLKSNISRTIGLVVTDITNPFFAAVAKAAEEYLTASEYSLIICNTSENPKTEWMHLKNLHGRRVDGLLLCATGQNNDLIASICEDGLPIILIDRDFHDLQLDVVKDDNYYGAYLLTEQLIRKNHSRIALLKGAATSVASMERERGFIQCCEKHGLLGYRNRILPGGTSGETAEKSISMLMKDGDSPTALIAVNSLIAKHVMMVLNNMGFSIPGDIALACYGLEEFKTLFRPSITCIVQHPERIGFLAAQLMMERIKTRKNSARREIIMAPDLFLGDSI